MHEKDLARFELDEISCTHAFDLKEFNTKGSYDLSGSNLMVVDRTLADYNHLENLPQIESVELRGNRRIEEFGMTKAQNTDILSLFK